MPGLVNDAPPPLTRSRRAPGPAGNQRMRRSLRRDLTVVIALLSVPACGDGTGGNARGSSQAAPGPVQMADEPEDYGTLAGQLATRIVRSSSLAEAVEPTRMALALGGIPTSDLRQTLMQARVPGAGYIVLPGEAINLAAEARNRPTTGTLTVAQLAGMMRELGWDFEPSKAPGHHLMDVFAAWIEAAETAPGEALSFTPLFLKEMAGDQGTAGAVLRPGSDPELVWLTLLEMQLFVSAIETVLPPMPTQTASPSATPYRFASLTANPCAEIRRSIGRLGTDERVLAEEAIGYAAGRALDGAIKKTLGDKAAEVVGRAQEKVLGPLMAIQKLAAYYRSAQISVDGYDRGGDIDEKHKASVQSSFFFKARVLLPDPSASGLNSGHTLPDLRECEKLAGLPTVTDQADVAAALDSWRIDWDIHSDPKHALITKAENFDIKGRMKMNLRRTGAYTGETPEVAMIVTPEAEHRGKVESSPVTAVASLEMDVPEEVIRAVLFQGTTPAFFTIATNMFAHLVNLKTRKTVKITYHVPVVYELTFDVGIEAWDEGHGVEYTMRMSDRLILEPPVDRQWAGTWQEVSHIGVIPQTPIRVERFRSLTDECVQHVATDPTIFLAYIPVDSGGEFTLYLVAPGGAPGRNRGTTWLSDTCGELVEDRHAPLWPFTDLHEFPDGIAAAPITRWRAPQPGVRVFEEQRDVSVDDLLRIREDMKLHLREIVVQEGGP